MFPVINEEPNLLKVDTSPVFDVIEVGIVIWLNSKYLLSKLI
jgi:hypothetical protein